ncbi:MAG: bifunctional oligoribonuclease and phosphatase NrnA [Gaiellales bacterium]|nr:bifunctional oligoribonuclease and phosphatase NrnA [Gaiellales bacterium]
MSDASYAEIARLLPAGPPLCLTTHESPDGDAIGSLLGAGMALEAAGRDVWLYLAGATPMPHEYGFLPVDRIHREPPSDLEQRELWAFDCGSARRIGPDASLLERPLRIINVDHHHDNTRFGALDLVDPEAACTAQIIERLLREAQIEIGSAVAEALYVGLVTDTGRFQYSNTTPETFRLAARLVDAGARPTAVFAEIWETVPFAKQRLLGIALEHARLEASGKLLVTWLTRDDYISAGADEPFSEGVVDHLRAVEGVSVAALVREPRELDGPRHKVSLRGRDAGVDVSKIARIRGGGGHVGAAGFTSDETIPEIVEFLRASVT